MPSSVTTKRLIWISSFFAFVFWISLSAYRLKKESDAKIVSRADKQTIVGSQWDPRGYDRLLSVIRKRESESFKDRLRRGLSKPFIWPGLQNLQSSITWLEVLEGLHHESSYDGDFSWMFSKLYTLILLTNPKEIRFLTGLAPFFLVIGKDHIGASILMQEVIERGGNEYNSWFYAGYHAMENLGDRKLAADYVLKASEFPFAPQYLKALHLRLKLGQEFLTSTEKRRIIEEEVKDPKMLETLKKVRPEWF